MSYSYAVINLKIYFFIVANNQLFLYREGELAGDKWEKCVDDTWDHRPTGRCRDAILELSSRDYGHVCLGFRSSDMVKKMLEKNSVVILRRSGPSDSRRMGRSVTIVSTTVLYQSTVPHTSWSSLFDPATIN